MAKENLGKLSPEQLQRLAGVISEAKNLTNQQAEIIEKVLAGEEDIGQLRISYLKKYFDVYSKNLDKIARKYREDLDDTFQILDTKLTESYKSLNNKPKGSSKATDGAPTSDSKKASSATSESSNGPTSKELVSILRELVTTLKANYAAGAGDETAATTSGGRTTGGTSSVGGSGSDSSTTLVTPSDTTSGDLPEISLLDQIELEKRRAKKRLETENEIHELKEKLIFDQNQEETALENRLADHRLKKEAERLAAQLENVLKVQKLEMDLADARDQSREAQEERLTEFRLKKMQEVYQAELDIQNLHNEFATETSFYQTDEGARLGAQEALVKDKLKFEQEEDKKLLAWKAKEELKSRLRNNGELTADEIKRINKAAEARKKADEANWKKDQERTQKKEKEKNRLESRGELKSLLTTPLGPGDGLKDRFNALKEHTMDKITPDDGGNVSKGAKAMAILDTAASAISDLAKQLENTVDKIGSYKGDIDTRLHGSKNDRRMGSYWDQLIVDMTRVGAVTPFFKQEDFASNIKSLVDRGIAFDLKQRAFLMTIKDKIATTFEAADGTLLRLIRLQQEDSTAGRLGMESALNSFLNEMYENTEYLKDVASGVRQSLQEMEALMSGKAATEIEYQVQKWMGSLYSVGMSQEAVQGIASALGQIAAGQIDGITGGSGAGNLLVMAANKSGKSIAEILTSGLNADETNDLLQATVNYLADIAESTKGNNVVQQQIAGVFGVKASDLRAATNLRSDPKDNKNSISDIHGENLKYSNMLNELFNMAGSIATRTSIAEMMGNIWANGQYTLAGSMANNPISYLTYKVASLLDSVAGGIAIPAFSVFGNMVDLETTIADLLRVASMSGGVLSSLGAMISGLGSSFSGKAMLRKLGIEEGDGALTINTRGGVGLGAEPTSDGNTVSESGYIGNGDGSNIKDTTMQAAADDKKKQMIKAKEEEPTSQVDMINNSVLKIYEILDEVVKGNKTLRVRVDNYGLTGNNKSTNSQGGVNSLAGHDTGFTNNATIGGTDDSAHNGVGGRTAGSSVTSLGGWTVL